MRRYNDSINPHQLYRNPEKGLLAGVCAGIADYLGVSALGVRILFVIGFIFFNLVFFVGYIALIFLLKKRPEEIHLNEDEEVFWRGVASAPRSTLSELKFKFMNLNERLKRMETHVTSSEYDLEQKYKNL